MQYYAERHGLIINDFNIDFEQLKGCFLQTYNFFNNKGYFECAEKGIWISKSYSQEEEQIIPPSLEPSAEVFFINHLHDSQIYPIWEYCEYYTEEILFTVIEILYNHIAYYDYQKSEIISVEPKKEFEEHINNILRFYKTGYYLESVQGFILKIPNEALKNLLQEDVSQIFEDETLTKLRSAVKLYYRFDSNDELRKKAINILADVIEPIREQLKDLLNEEYEVNKNKHDKLIFDIVNNYNVRHNNENQKKNYSKEIWYDWMMQYYTSTIITYYKLIKDRK